MAIPRCITALEAKQRKSVKTTEEFAVPCILITKGYRIYALTLQCFPIWDWFGTIQIGREEANLIGKDINMRLEIS